jgi:curli biogenesis system outer membrane secretion channel CsgG
MKRIRTLAVVAVAVSAPMVATAVTASASAAVTCSTSVSADRHTAKATCTGTLAGHSQFRVRANFCNTANCAYGYGAWVNFGAGTSTVTSGGYTTAADTDVQFR